MSAIPFSTQTVLLQQSSYWATLSVAGVWGMALLAAYTGYGSALARFLSLPGKDIPIGWKCTAGISVSILLGGYLNLFSLISAGVLWSFVAVGVFLFFRLESGTIGRRIGSLRLMSTPVFLCITVCLTFVIYGSSLLTSDFNPHDDFHAYFVFPLKMLQAGGLGLDPYSERRVVTGLGGQPLLGAFVLCMLPLQSLDLMDVGVGTMLLIFLLFGYAQTAKAPPGITQILVACFLSMLLLKVNITTSILGVGILFTLLWMVRKALSEERGGRLAILIGLVGGCGCTLKTTLIPPIGLITAAFLLHLAISSGARVALQALLRIAGSMAVMLIPWMVAEYRSCGTPLFPFFGNGFHAEAYGNWLHGNNAPNLTANMRLILRFFSDPPQIALLALGAYLCWRRRSLLLVAFLMIVIVTTIATVVATEGYHVFRYCFPVLFAFLAMVVLDLSSAAEDGPKIARFIAVGTVLLLLPLFFFTKGTWNLHRTNELRLRIEAALDPFSPPFAVPPDLIQSVHHMQDKIPPGSIVLARLSHPYLLNFRRNTVYIADYPGGASPPPGMPFFQGEEPLAQYLVSYGVRYLAYSYGDEAGFSKREFYAERTSPFMVSIIRAEGIHTFDFQDNVARLMKSRKRLFDDGFHVVIDLAAKS